jgi:hypothetical protein
MIAVAGLILLAAAAARYTVTHVHGFPGLLAALVILLAAGAVLRWFTFPGRRLPRNRVRMMRVRLRLGLRPGPGHATGVECWWRWGRFATFRRSRRARRSLSAWRRYWRPSEHAFLAGRAYRLHRLLVPSEEHALVMAPPRTRKTGWLAKVILRWPGPVLATSTKTDLFALTSGVRARAGRVHVFNPQGIGSVPSTFQWDPLDGCDVPSVAIRRADAFAHAVSQKGVEDAAFWSAKASDFLRAQFCAAAVGGYDLRQVALWVMSGDAREAQQILAAHGYRQWAGQLAEMDSEARRTAATVRMTMSRALAFLADPQLAQCVLPGPGAGLDIAGFLAGDQTLYLVAEATGDGQEAPVSALFACLASEIRYQAALYGSSMPGGRLDPPLLMALDEATQICPCPVPSWLADSGGKGITIITVTHGEAQLAARWGEHGKQTILDTSGVKIWLPGIAATATLEAASTLAGDTAYLERGWEHATRHPILTGAMVRQLPPGYALVVRGGLSPVIAHIPVAWHDRRYLPARVRRQDIATVRSAVSVSTEGQVPEPSAPAGHWPLAGEYRPAPPPGPAGPGARLPWNRPGSSDGPDGSSGDGGRPDGGHDGL